jgi:murein DD-endopeptidase MepM/ murein hydrolase activator NlpD
MLRALLAVVILSIVGGIGFYFGRSSAPVPSSPPAAASNPGDQSLPGAADATRSRTEPPALPSPPPVTPDQSLPNPTLPNSVKGQAPGDSAPLTDRALGLPIVGLKASDIQDTFLQSRGNGERRHEATDILAPRGTPVVAVDTGIIAKLFTSKPGGLTIYQFNPQQTYAYYYAHLDRYAPGLKESMLVKKGDIIGYVGTTGNADPNTPHLHFTIFELGPEKHWWEGRAVNPYPLLMQAVGH